MPKYLSASEIDKKLGLSDEADEIRNAVVEELKDNPENPDSDAKADTEQEGVIAKILSGFSDVIAKLEKGIEDLVAEVKATSEGLLAANNKFSELGEKVGTLEQANGRIEQLENWKADKLTEEEAAKAEEAVDEDDRCPECRADVGFKDLEAQKEYGGKYDIIKYMFKKESNGKDADGREVIGEFRQCPECGHKEPAGKEAEVSEV